jgi:hypothetical protein
MLYAVAIAVHVLVAVLAVGLVGAVPLTARLARQSPAAGETILRALLRALQIGLAVMLLSGVLLDFAVAGGYHHMRWFQASIVALVVLGVSLGRARAELRRGALRRVEGWGWAMCASVAVITFLMQMKVPATW